ncbi:MAG: hypothetical protein WCT12_26260 [Verrucomicrobiota bacterium]
MKIAPIDDWPVLDNFYRKLAQDMHAHGITSLTTGGFACVLYSLTQKTKDCDIIIPIQKTDAALRLLARTTLESHKCHLTLKYGAPLHERWLNGGWSSHTYFGPPSQPIARVDIFGNPPRVCRLEADENPLFLSRDGVARMKKTQRDKDWAFVNLLGNQMLLRGDPAGLLHITDPQRLVKVARNTTISQSMLTERPMLKLAVEDSPDVERYVKAEKDFLFALDRLRLDAYEKAWVPYGTAIQNIPGILQLELQDQNQALIQIAEQTLDPNPIQTVGWHKLIEQAKNKTTRIFQNLDASLLPTPNSFFGQTDGCTGNSDQEL